MTRHREHRRTGRRAIGATEVALKQAELDAAQTDPVVFPTPDRRGNDLAGPDWVQIGTEGGFLPAPVVVDGQQETTWITDPTRFDVGNVDKHSLLLAPAERADAIVDFSKFAGKTLILYNDAPAAFPARVPVVRLLHRRPGPVPAGAPTILPGYGPNTRTIMQVKIADTAPATGVQPDQAQQRRSRHKADGTGVFESGAAPDHRRPGRLQLRLRHQLRRRQRLQRARQHLTRCDGLVRINDGTQVRTRPGASTPSRRPNAKMTIKLEPKAIHDEMNSTTFDEFGRMTANLGIEAQPPTPGLQNVTLYPYVNPQTELIDATNLPKNDVTYDATRRARERREDHPDLLGDGRDPDLAGHPQRRGHAPDPLPPLRRAGAQPGHLGQHHQADRTRRSWAGRTRCGSARSRTRSSPCARSSPSCRGRSRTPSACSTR